MIFSFMQTKAIILLNGCFLFVLLTKGIAGPADTLYAANLNPIGRAIINAHKQLELITSAAHFGISFKGTYCKIYVSLHDTGAHNYLQYELDGIYKKKIYIAGNSQSPIIITANKPGSHSIWIYKTTEATTGSIMITKLVAKDIRSLKEPDRPLIEFIGNSITCGAAADDSEMPCGVGTYLDHHNAYMAYGPRVARALKASYILSSVSGIGIYRTWNRDSPSMPQVYEHTYMQVDNALNWDFKTYKPKIVSIALGTNDMSKGDGTPRTPFDTTHFINEYVKFIQLVKSKYPTAQIALLSSPIMTDTLKDVLQQCLIGIKQKVDKLYPANRPVAVFFFKPMEVHGCAGHPSVADHKILAIALEPFFKRLLKN